MLDQLDVKETADGVTVRVKVQPKASRNKIAGTIGESIKVCLTAPPVDGAANAACIEYFADIFDIPKSRIIILSGHTSRNKIIKINSVSKQQLQNKLEELL